MKDDINFVGFTGIHFHMKNRRDMTGKKLIHAE